MTLSAGDRVRFDTKLQVGLVAETITVTAASPLLQTDTSTLSALVTEKAVQDLPVNGRNFVRLVQLAPGAHEGLPNSLASGTRPDDRRQTSAISINGALDNQNNQLIDGMDNNERAIGTIGVKPSIDAIAEVKVQTSNYTAETGRTAGGVVNILTKSGTNNFRGSAFEFARNDRFDAKNFFAATKPVLSQHQYRRQPRRTAPRRSDVLLRRLRRVPADAGGHQRDHRADGPDAQRRLLASCRSPSTIRWRRARRFPTTRFRPTGSTRSR